MPLDISVCHSVDWGALSFPVIIKAPSTEDKKEQESYIDLSWQVYLLAGLVNI